MAYALHCTALREFDALHRTALLIIGEVLAIAGLLLYQVACLERIVTNTPLQLTIIVNCGAGYSGGLLVTLVMVTLVSVPSLLNQVQFADTLQYVMSMSALGTIFIRIPDKLCDSQPCSE